VVVCGKLRIWREYLGRAQREEVGLWGCVAGLGTRRMGDGVEASWLSDRVWM